MFAGLSQKSACIKNMAPSVMASRRLPDLSGKMPAQTQTTLTMNTVTEAPAWLRF